MRNVPFISLKLLSYLFIGYSFVTLSTLCFSKSSQETTPVLGVSSSGNVSSATSPVSFELRGPEGLWFNRLNPHCNALEVELTLRGSPPPSSPRGAALAGLCYALAGKTRSAENIFTKLPADVRTEPLRILIQMGINYSREKFDPGIGSSMDLVLKYLPDNKAALYLSALAKLANGETAQGKEILRQLQAADAQLAVEPRFQQLLHSRNEPIQSDVELLEKICPNPKQGENC